MNLKFDKCNDFLAWDKFLFNSNQSSVFSESWLLQERNKKYDFFYVSEGTKNLAAVMIALESNNTPTTKPWIYHGIFYDKKLEINKNHSNIRKKIEISKFIIDELEKIYESISLSFHHSIQDLRAFQWHNHNQEEINKFKIKINYTSILNLNSYSSFENYLKSIRSVRRQEYNRCIREGYKTEISRDIDLLNFLHEETFKRQGLSRNIHDEILSNQIARNAIENNHGQIISCKDKDGTYLSVALFIFHKATTYYLIGATDQNYRKSSPMTLIILNHIKDLNNLGIDKVDFCGINSPNRGDYKLSFNGNVTPFYEVSLHKKIF